METKFVKGFLYFVVNNGNQKKRECFRSVRRIESGVEELLLTRLIEDVTVFANCVRVNAANTMDVERYKKHI